MPRYGCTTALLALVALSLSVLPACGGGGGGGPAPAPVLYRASAYQDGNYAVERFYIDHHAWDGGASDWIRERCEFQFISLTLAGNGLSGAAWVERLRDGTGTWHTADGYTQSGWTVGEPVTIVGFVDGTVLGMEVQSPSGATAHCLWVVYDGDVAGVTPDMLFTEIWTLAGTVATTTPGSYASTGSYMFNLARVGAATAAPAPVPVSVAGGGGGSIYQDGHWTGHTNLYFTYDDGGFTYNTIRFDLELTFSGSAVTGTGTLVETNDWPDFDGHLPGDGFMVTGTITGSGMSLVLSDGVWGYRIVYAPDDLAGLGPPGTVGEFEAMYGAAFDPRIYWGGETYLSLNRVP